MSKLKGNYIDVYQVVDNPKQIDSSFYSKIALLAV